MLNSNVFLKEMRKKRFDISYKNFLWGIVQSGTNRNKAQRGKYLKEDIRSLLGDSREGVNKFIGLFILLIFELTSRLY